MSVMESVARPPVKRPPVAAREDIWVFESNLGGHHLKGATAIALECHGAEEDKYSGAAGTSYALPTRGDDGQLLGWDTMKSHVRVLFDYARKHPQLRFRILASSQKKSTEEHRRFADLLRNAPANCELPGRLLEILDRLTTVRIILLDANVRMVAEDRKRVLDQYFAANAGLWDADQIEIVSLGSAQSIVANDKYAKGRGYRHRIINVDAEVYRGHAGLAREQLSVTYATKLVCLNDPTGTSTGTQIGAIHLAACAGLEIDEVLIQ